MKILLIQGNPELESFCGSLASAYERGARAGGHEVRRLDLGQMEFDPVLRKSLSGPEEEDVLKAREWILWCEKIVIIYPIWWGSWPALLKGFVDRVMVTGFAYKYREGSAFWDQLLKGRNAHLITTCDAPKWWIWWRYGSADLRAMKEATLEFCGIKPVGVTRIDRVRFLSAEQKREWCDRVEKMAKGS